MDMQLLKMTALNDWHLPKRKINNGQFSLGVVLPIKKGYPFSLEWMGWTVIFKYRWSLDIFIEKLAQLDEGRRKLLFFVPLFPHFLERHFNEVGSSYPITVDILICFVIECTEKDEHNRMNEEVNVVTKNYLIGLLPPRPTFENSLHSRRFGKKHPLQPRLPLPC